MIWQRTDDLRGYLRDAVLPELKYGPDTPDLPPPGHKSHRNTLSTRFRKYRHLTAIHYLGPSFDEVVNEWISARVPAKSAGFRDEDKQNGEALTIPSARRFKINAAIPAPVTDSTRLWSWVDHFPLRTVQRVLHIIFPKIRDWNFVSDDAGIDDADIYKEFYFTDTRNPPSPKVRFNSVVVVCQPPWVLSDEDMWQFTELKSLPMDNAPLRAKERLWAKLWDTCVRRQSTYFVVTSYQQWVFGAFSRGFTNAFVSPPIGAQSRDPTVIHATIYWLASALAVEDGYVPPCVPEPVDYVMGDIPIAPRDNNDDIATIVDSLSSWTGKKPASSAHAAEVIPALESERGASGEVSDWAPVPYVRPRDLIANRRMVERWRQTLPGCDDVRDAELPPSLQDFDSLYGGDLWTDDPDDTACTVSSDHTEIGETKGHWLTRTPFLCTQ
ncbi:hypothetical protein EDC04DRAFT_2886452 [Pisolithus marmoratus]|nr:hypothetical protein EDC04DRAFT_2886452 [Pisolithus marmoratus]